MAEVVWAAPAIADLEAIAEYIAIDDPAAAAALVRRVLDHVLLLEAHPELGSRPREIRGKRYRQIVEPPCRVFYRYDGERVFVLFVMRGERRLRATTLTERERG